MYAYMNKWINKWVNGYYLAVSTQMPKHIVRESIKQKSQSRFPESIG